MEITQQTRKALLTLAQKKKVYLEGNILKVLKAEAEDQHFKEYLATCKAKDSTARKKRLEVTKRVQSQNKELEEAATKNKELLAKLKEALGEAERLKDEALEDLDTLQKRTQFELIGLIVKVALIIIIGVGVLSTSMYLTALLMNKDTTLLGNAWSNLIGILLTNSFSIIGTIMGVKYATENKD